MNEAGETYDKLGSKTLLVFLLRRSSALFVFIFMFITFLIVQHWAPDIIVGMLPVITLGLLIVGVIIFVFTLLFALLEYSRLSISLTEDDIKITRGLVTVEEIGVPYRRIKAINIERDVLDQMLGMSRVSVTVLGEEEGVARTEQSSIILPPINKDLAAHIRDEVLKKAEVEVEEMRPEQP